MSASAHSFPVPMGRDTYLLLAVLAVLLVTVYAADPDPSTIKRVHVSTAPCARQSSEETMIVLSSVPSASQARSPPILSCDYCCIIIINKYESFLLVLSISRRPHVVFSNHLDVGYSLPFNGPPAYISQVLDLNFHAYLPQAAKNGIALAAKGLPYHYMSQPWLIYNFFHCQELHFPRTTPGLPLIPLQSHSHSLL